MIALREWKAAILLNLSSLGRRLGSSGVIVVSMASVVAVLVSIMAMASGITATLLATGRADRAIVLSGGATQESVSGLSLDAVRVIADAPGIAHAKGGAPLVSSEKILSVRATKIGSGLETSLTLRGVGQQAFRIRPEIAIVEGRPFRPGLREVIVGEGARAQFRDLGIGKSITLRGSPWTIVGVFNGGNLHDSEILTDVETLRSALHSTDYNSVTALLSSAQAYAEFKRYFANDPDVSVNVMREDEYFDNQTKDISGLVELVAKVIASIMSVGALFATLTIMYDAVSARSMEIGTLRAIGFSPMSVVSASLAEAMLLASLGALIGAAIAWLALNGATTSAEGGASQIVFKMHVDLKLVAVGIAWAALVGLVGGLMPALRAARSPVATVLRGL